MEIDSDGRDSQINLVVPVHNGQLVISDKGAEVYPVERPPSLEENMDWVSQNKKKSKEPKKKCNPIILKSIAKKLPIIKIQKSQLVSEIEHSFVVPEMVPNISGTTTITTSAVNSINSRTKYQASDCGPYVVYAELISDTSTNKTLHPLKFGAFLYKNQLKNILQDGIKKIGRNRLSVTFRTAKDANEFLEIPIFKDNGYKIYIPSFNISRMGIVKGIPQDWSHEEIIDSVKLPPGVGHIIRTRRMNRKEINQDGVNWIPTQTVVITFDGQILPKEIYCCFTVMPVEQYVYPTIQCYNCCRFGHTRTQCRSKPKCYKCGDNHSADNCLIEETDTICSFCSGQHYAINKTCPEYARQSNIKHHMAHYNVSYQEAMTHFPQTKKSYAEIASSQEVQRSLRHQQTTSVIRPVSKSQQDRLSSVPNFFQSYKKTVTLKPPSRPTLNPGYDQQAHKNIIKSFEMPEPPNGCALNNQGDKDIHNEESLPQIKSIQELLSSLVQVVYKSKLPSNVASHIIHTISVTIFQLLNDGLHSSVE